MAVMIVLFKAELEADDWSGHGGGEAEGQWIRRARLCLRTGVCTRLPNKS